MADPQIQTFVCGDLASPAKMQGAQSSYPVAPPTEDVRSASLGALADLSEVTVARSKVLKSLRV
jgi:hypothetical protein